MGCLTFGLSTLQTVEAEISSDFVKMSNCSPNAKLLKSNATNIVTIGLKKFFTIVYFPIKSIVMSYPQVKSILNILLCSFRQCTT